jgi:hypothetical protein
MNNGNENKNSPFFPLAFTFKNKMIKVLNRINNIK